MGFEESTSTNHLGLQLSWADLPIKRKITTKDTFFDLQETSLPICDSTRHGSDIHPIRSSEPHLAPGMPNRANILLGRAWDTSISTAPTIFLLQVVEIAVSEPDALAGREYDHRRPTLGFPPSNLRQVVGGRRVREPTLPSMCQHGFYAIAEDY